MNAPRFSALKHVVFPLILAVLWVGIFNITFENAGQFSLSFFNTEEDAQSAQNAQKLSSQHHKHILPRQTFSGSYLSGLFAQRRSDWDSAYIHMSAALGALEEIAEENEDDSIHSLLRKRTVILGIGSGHYDQAFRQSLDVSSSKAQSLSLLFLAVRDFKEKNYESARQHMAQMQAGTISDFIAPLLENWAMAGQGDLADDFRRDNAMHAYHALLIADYLDKPQEFEALLEKAVQIRDLQLQDLERLANGYTHIGKHERALDIYRDIFNMAPGTERIADKINALEAGEKPDYFTSVSSPAEGLANALYDMALVLYQEHSDESARLFSSLALYLDPQMSDAHLLMAGIATRNERYQEAIDAYRNIAPEDTYYEDSRLRIGALLEEMEQFEAAQAELQSLYDEHNSVDALIEMGHMERRRENFSEAIAIYNRAEAEIGKPVPEEYWNLLYARGMAYEQNDQWDQAEVDLQAALELRPNDPYILNYLGYAWTDRGENLAQSLEMIRRAVSLKPNDGYITDSLGWAYYRMGDYAKALPYLEKAAELLPYDPVINDHLGDVYWKLGRKLEARFQWMRAKDNGDDQKLIAGIEDKLEHGLKPDLKIMEAKSNIETDEEGVLKHP